ncbi:MAG: GxxExxY protein [Gemmatimonadota bacterium]
MYNRLGHGFLESVYQKALANTLERTGTRVLREAPMTVEFEGVAVGDFRADLVVEERVIVEVKAVDRLGSVHETQLLNYLRASGLDIGLLLNFGPKASCRRLVNPRANHPPSMGVHSAAPT